jgi:membrane protein insertase Oxa1/YidC/SpoIIIJ
MNAVTAIAVVMIVGMTCGIPLLGLTIRFSLKPLVDAFMKMREAQAGTPQIQALQQRVAYLERQLELRGMMERPSLSPMQQLSPENLPVAVKDRERI